MLWLVVVLLGLIEGPTEFIPVSSTGHLLLADHFLGFERLIGSKEKADLFDIAIQAGAIFAVGWLYRSKLTQVAVGAFTGGSGRRLLIALFIAFLPVAVVGLALHKAIQHYLFFPVPIACALLAGGIAIAVIEWMRIRPRSSSVDQISYRQAFAVGAAQVLSLIPGLSRSGATIMGGLCAGLDRTTATEFSFLLAFPTMLAAVGFDLLKHWRELDAGFVGIFIVGLLTAFVSAVLMMRWLIHYVQRHNFNGFAAYRIVLGIILLALVWRLR